MAEGVDERPVTRPGRCANHPSVGAVDTCSWCGSPLCMPCAVPVRGRVLGIECLGKVLEDPPAPETMPGPGRLPGDWVALVGFAIVVAASAFPWSRFGPSSRAFGAWTPHWSLVAAIAGLAGLGLAILRRSHPVDERLTASAYGALGAVVIVASVIQHRHPPLLTEATWWPWVAAAGGIVALIAAIVKGRSLIRERRPGVRRPPPVVDSLMRVNENPPSWPDGPLARKER